MHPSPPPLLKTRKTPPNAPVIIIQIPHHHPATDKTLLGRNDVTQDRADIHQVGRQQRGVRDVERRAARLRAGCVFVGAAFDRRDVDLYLVNTVFEFFLLYDERERGGGGGLTFG